MAACIRNTSRRALYVGKLTETIGSIPLQLILSVSLFLPLSSPSVYACASSGYL